MKRVMKLSLVVFAMLLSNITAASDDISVKVENSSTINVTLSNVFKGQRLTITDYYGKVVYNVKVDRKSTLFSKVFDFETFTDGVYYVETETKSDIRITPVIKSIKGISIVDRAVETISKPKVVVEGDYLTLTYNQSQSEKSPLIIYVYDYNGSLVFEEDVKEDHEVIRRNFNISKLPIGKYTVDVTLTNSDRFFTQEIKL
ncbi:hypothetical protein [Aquimarina pacifica]|uniref:hypothetical protein n=1 Tax=Aquimarina pacifica TaxID=1296415 RepID=UPI0004701F2E|nr:hypothetical protein [Aquimarina pacifica]